jgi:adenylate cyclase
MAPRGDCLVAEQRAQRQLTAILAADVAGYSRLIGLDEEGTLKRLKELRRTVIDPLIKEHRGRIVKVMGDGLLVQFSSVVDAVRCAMESQRKITDVNAGAEVDRRIELRMGINVGDVVIDGEDLYGEGVNIAARLEGLAEPGGICISGVVYEHIRDKVDAIFIDVGERQLRNITRPVRVYRAKRGNDIEQTALTRLDTSSRAVLSEASQGHAALALPDKPSIAVLPFQNMSGDPEQEYFADGLAEDLITELSRFKSLFVISRNSTFRYKGSSPKIQDVKRELGADWLVEGSVRKIDKRVRVSAQLINAEAGVHVWAERYDREIEDIFAVQDDVVRTIVGTISGQLDRIAGEAARRKPPTNLTAFDHFLRAIWAGRHSSEGPQQELQHLERAVAADPTYAAAHAEMAFVYSYGIYALGLDPNIAIDRACSHATGALVLDGMDSKVNAAAAIAYILSGLHELADIHSERAILANPNDPWALNSRGVVLTYLGRPNEGMEYLKLMQSVDPYVPDDMRFESRGDCLFMLGDYEGVRSWHNMPVHLRLQQAAACALLGRFDDAKAALIEFERSTAPKPDPQTMVKFHIRMMARQEDRDRWLEGYRKAGLTA